MTVHLSRRPPERPAPRRRVASEVADLDQARVARLVRAAAQGDEAAWDALLERFEGPVNAVVRTFRLSEADKAEVVQTTWLRAVENLHRLKEPGRLGPWLSTVARRESLRTIRRRTRERVSDDELFAELPDRSRIDARILSAEREAALHLAVGALPPRQQVLLLTLLGPESSPSYQSIARDLAMPVGSIGPTLGRACERLRRNPELAAAVAD